MVMKIILKIFAFLAVNVIGFLGTAITFHIAQLHGKFTETADPIVISAFFQNALFAWAAGAVISVGFFVTNGLIRFVLLCAPILAVGAYSLKFLFFSS